MDCKNQLYFGDNLKNLREYVADASIDLIYLDPPFNSNATYNVLFKEKTGEESAAQIMAFKDTCSGAMSGGSHLEQGLGNTQDVPFPKLLEVRLYCGH